MRNNHAQAGVPQSEIGGIITSEMFHHWQKLVPTKKIIPPQPRLRPQSTADPGKCRNNRSSGWWVPPHCCHCSLSLGAGPTALCSSNYQAASGGTLPVSALVDTGTEVTVLQGDIALNEEICALGGSSTLLSKPRLL